MTETEEELFTLEESADFDFTRSKRKQVIEHMTQDGIPSSPRMLEVLLSALKDSDDTIIKKTRLKQTAKRDEQDQNNASEIIAGLMLSIGRKPPETTKSAGVIPTDVPDRIASIEISDQELDDVNSAVRPADLKA